jgi:hypothetical protein
MNKIRTVLSSVLHVLKRIWSAVISALRAFLSFLQPDTSFGRWSLGLGVASLAAPIVLGLINGFNTMDEGIDTVSLVMLQIIFIAMSGDALVIGLLGIFRHKERHFLVFTAVLINLWLCVAELAWLVHLNKSIYPLGLID